MLYDGCCFLCEALLFVMPFSQSKFYSLPVEQQHKKCAESLREIYLLLRDSQSAESQLSIYHQLQKWLGPTLPQVSGLQQVADRYHYHLKLAKQQLKEHNLLPAITKGDRAEGRDSLSLAIYLDHIRSAHNIGSILRTTEAFALGELYFSSGMVSSNHPQVQKASMGAYEWVTTHSDVAIADLPRPIIALETSPTAAPLQDFPFPSSFTLALGNEEYGCSSELLRAADHLVQIPLYGRKNSLNVANAYAIAAAHISTAFRP